MNHIDSLEVKLGVRKSKYSMDWIFKWNNNYEFLFTKKIPVLGLAFPYTLNIMEYISWANNAV